jgi:hypothetical protein
MLSHELNSKESSVYGAWSAAEPRIMIIAFLILVLFSSFDMYVHLSSVLMLILIHEVSTKAANCCKLPTACESRPL